MAVAVAERLKQELMYGLSAGTKKCGRCREVAVSGGSTVFCLSSHAIVLRELVLTPPHKRLLTQARGRR